jgi:hypothetical protein
MALFRTENEQVGYGKFCTDGTLGYDDYPFRIPEKYTDKAGQIISAHAPSSFKIHLTAPVTVFGVLNSTVRTREAPCKFYINDHLLGHVYSGYFPTMPITLPKGAYQFTVSTTDKNAAHSGWYLIPTLPPPVTERNTLFVICSSYEPKTKAWALEDSAKAANIQFSNGFVGDRWQSLYVNKITNLYNFYLDAQKKGKKFVLFTDSRDVIVRHHSLVVLGRLNYLFSNIFDKKIIISSDIPGYNWPIKDAAWTQLLYTNVPNASEHINSGGYFGTIEDVIEMLKYAIAVHTAVTQHSPFDEATQLLIDRERQGRMWNDQGQIQAFYIMHNDKIRIDKDKELFAVTLESPRRKTEPLTPSPQLKYTVCNASFIHSPVTAWTPQNWKNMYNTVLVSQDDLQ